ncbi:anti-sigma factor antagonist [Candidatus Parcubacteria bacterium]|jgi:anti-anti-sigma factor|nr:MAG: anti-sigma factor antagonist [Candidatus Parcubacteria bacterium]
MQFQIKEQNSVVVISPQGAFEGDRDDKGFQEIINQNIAQGKTIFLVNFSGVPRMNELGLGLLLGAYRKTTARSVYMVFCNFNKAITQMLERTKLNTFFKCFDSEAEALAELQKCI